MKYIILFITLSLSLSSIAQKEDYIWQLGIDDGIDVGIQTMEVNFNQGPFNINIKNTPVGFDHNNRAICDTDGNLLFYTNGCAIVNRQHEIMPNGHRMNWDSLFTAWTGWNEDCSIGYPGIQNILILDDPAHTDGYYIIHKAGYFANDGNTHRDFRFSYVDMSLENGLGDVVVVDSILKNIEPLGSFLTAIRHTNKKDWWLLQPLEESALIATFLINEDGLIRLDDQNSFEYYDYWFSSASGTSRFSPDGTKYAHFSRVDDLQLYDFDRSSGQLSNHQKIELFETPRDSSDHKFGSVEWSPNGRFIYTCAQDTLLQIDTWENDIQSDGIRFIDEYNGTLDPFPTTFEVMALAPDCKIYMCSGNGSDSYHVIKKPNELGIDCNFMQNGIKLPQGAGSANIPLHPRWRVDEQHKCDNTITSVFGLEVYYRHNLKVYPNPTDGPLSIELPEGFIEGQLEVYDMEGVLIMNQKINPNESPLEISIINLPPGNYNIEIYPIRNFDRRYFTSQVIKIN